MNLGLFVSTYIFAIGIALLFGVLPIATIVNAFDNSKIDPNKMLALLPVSIVLMFIGGVGMSAFG